MTAVPGMLLTFIFWLQQVAAAPADLSPREQDAQTFLGKFGYLNTNVRSSVSPEDVKAAVLEFQRFAGLNETGELDSATMRLMMSPRCGNRDVETHARRRKRYNLQGSSWQTKTLTYRINSYPRTVDRNLVDREIQLAWKVWSDNANLTFTRVYEGDPKPDIDIIFASGYHGDQSSFDGPGGVLAHAYFPEFGGDVHFDNDETYTIRLPGKSGIDVFSVAVHEFGHTLGLSHSQIQQAIMYPWYKKVSPDIKLPSDDRTAIQRLYGKPHKMPAPSPPTSRPDRCGLRSLDAAFYKDRYTYFFSGVHFWRLTDNGVDTGYPQLISSRWKLPTGIDAAVTSDDGQFLYFFKGSQYWKFREDKAAPEEGYPKGLGVEGFKRLPTSGVDAVFRWSGNNRIYFIKGDKYYRLDREHHELDDNSIHQAYPRPLSVWKGLPNRVKAALQWSNGRTYFFSGSLYWRFNDKTFKVDDTYPRSTVLYWLRC